MQWGGVQSVECEGSEDSEDIGVLSGECDVTGVKWGLWSAKCRVKSLECRVWSVECKV